MKIESLETDSFILINLYIKPELQIGEKGIILFTVLKIKRWGWGALGGSVS